MKTLLKLSLNYGVSGHYLMACYLWQAIWSERLHEVKHPHPEKWGAIVA